MVMDRFFLRVILLSIIGLLGGGCAVPEKDKPIWERMKITDLEPPNKEQGGIEPLKTIDFDIIVFEIPAENIKAFDGIWGMLYTQPLRFNDRDAFKANLFLAGFGQIEMLRRIDSLLQAADAKKAERTSLFLQDGQADDVMVARLPREQTVFYISTGDSTEGATLGPGVLVLRIKADKITGSRGVCSVSIQPVFVSGLALNRRTDEFSFARCGFELKMSPQDFVFLGTEKYISHQMTLSGLLFSKTAEKPVVRSYMIFCSGISD